MSDGLLNVIGTGSRGNCLAVYDSRGNYILLDAGLTFNKILKGLDYNTHGLSGAFVTHRHQDHSKAIKDLLKYGVKVYANDKDGHIVDRCCYIEPNGFRYSIKSYKQYVP